MQPLKLLVISNPNAQHLSVLQELPGSTTITVGLAPEAFEKAASEADVLLNGMAIKDTLQAIWPQCKKVRWVHSLSAGVENVLFPALIESPVPLTNARGVFKRSLAEFVLTSILYFAKDIPRMNRNKAAGKWEPFTVEEAYGATVGIIGYGEIGRAAAEKCHAMGMRVVATRRRGHLSNNDPMLDKTFPIEQRAEMIAECDYIVVATPHTPETVGLVGEAEIAAMKPTAVIINVGRGPVISEEPLIKALQAGKIKGAGLDVFTIEPLPPGSPLWKLENVLISPHCADNTRTWLEDAMRLFVTNFKRFQNGEPLLNVVDKRAGY